MSNVKIDTALNELVNVGGISCPFCGAPNAFIEVYKIKAQEKIATNVLDNGKFESIMPAPAAEFHCLKCNAWWIYNNKNNFYQIAYDPKELRTIQDLTGKPAVPIKSFERYYKSYDKGILFMPAALEMPLMKPTYEDLVTESTRDKMVGEVLLNHKIKLIQRKKLKNKVKENKSKDVVWKDQGRYIIVNKKQFEDINQDLTLDTVKKLDEEFELNGWLIKITESSKKPSNFEQICSKYLKNMNEHTIDTFIDFIKDKFKSEANQLNAVKNIKK